MSQPVSRRAFIVGMVLAAVVGACASLAVGYAVLPDRTLKVVEDHAQEIAYTLDVPDHIEIASVAEGAQAEFDPELAWQAVESDPERLQQLVNDGGPTTADLCASLQSSSNGAVSDVGYYGC